jgi:hypothetical protein
MLLMFAAEDRNALQKNVARQLSANVAELEYFATATNQYYT